jgi:hypothetical protein
MALVQELMAAGTPAGAANQLGQDIPGTGLTATGTTQANAFPLVSSFSVFSTVGASSGAVLPGAGGQQPFVVVNGGASTLTVYPAVGQSINALAANAGVSVPTAKTAIFIAAGVQWAANISA